MQTNSSPGPVPSAAHRSLWQMVVYAFGECANSLVMNGVFGFAMLYFTKALGLSPVLAGIAMSISVFWEAISEPIMGHLSDNTRSRWGRRHPYMAVGGLMMALCTYSIWSVPEMFRGNTTTLFFYLVVMNLLLRTALTMFFIPYVALGFEICTDYQDRSKLQAARQVLNMIANFFGPAMAWTLFFQDRNGVKGTDIPSNYYHMGAAFSIATAIAVIIVVASTYRWHEDTRKVNSESTGCGIESFFMGMKQILLDPYPRWVFLFIFIVCVGMVLVSSLQMFLYVDFMNFGAGEKTIAHGSTMVGCGLGGAISAFLAQRFDKKGAVIIGGVLSIGANFLLALLFLTSWLPVNLMWQAGGLSIPVSLILFVIFHASYWMGNGIMLPLSNAMIADVSEIHLLQTGINKDGGYASVYSLAMRLAISFSITVSGCCLTWIGYKTAGEGSEAVVQTAAAIWRLGAVTLIIGPIISIAALGAIWKYPVTRERLALIRGEFQSKNAEFPPRISRTGSCDL